MWIIFNAKGYKKEVFKIFVVSILKYEKSDKLQSLEN